MCHHCIFFARFAHPVCLDVVHFKTYIYTCIVYCTCLVPNEKFAVSQVIHLLE